MSQPKSESPLVPPHKAKFGPFNPEPYVFVHPNEKENKELKRSNASLKGRIARLKKENEKLRGENRVLRNALDDVKRAAKKVMNIADFHITH